MMSLLGKLRCVSLIQSFSFFICHKSFVLRFFALNDFVSVDIEADELLGALMWGEKKKKQTTYLEQGCP